MSVIIVFPNGTDWFKANWVFRQLAQDATSRHRNDIEFCKVFEVAEALGTLDLKQMNDGQRRRVMEAMESVALDTISGAICGWRPNDPKEGVNRTV